MVTWLDGAKHVEHKLRYLSTSEKENVRFEAEKLDLELELTFYAHSRSRCDIQTDLQLDRHCTVI